MERHPSSDAPCGDFGTRSSRSAGSDAYCEPPPDEAASVSLLPRSGRHRLPDRPASCRPTCPAAAAERRKQPCFVSGAFGRPPVPCFDGQVFMPFIDLLLKVVLHFLQVVDRHQTVLPAAQSAFLLLAMLTFTFWSSSGVSVSRVMTSPCVSAHSWPSATTARSSETTNVRRAGSSAGGTSFAPPLAAPLRRGCGRTRLGSSACCSRDLRLHFICDRRLNFRRERYLAASRRRSATIAGHLIIRRRGIVCALGCCVGFRLRRIRRLQIRRDQIVGEPESCRRIYGIRREISAVVSVPGRAAPSPSVVNRRCPRVIRPAVVARAEIIRVIVAVVGDDRPSIAAINARPVSAMVVVRPRIIGMSAAR